ncbi:hypothetical protein [Saccharopolyspora taberi]|uniref:Lipoprotein n=1 Tax=Saccharopolyspora taberi TaxID=60895 RepID=A0ABN3V0J2_9PSEU
MIRRAVLPAACLAALAGCGASGPDPEVVAEAAQLTGVRVPPGAEVLGAQCERGQDVMCKIAVAVGPGDVEALLGASGVVVALEPGRAVSLPPVDGVAVGADVASAQEEVGTGAFREILVDRSDPARSVLHVWGYTT